MKSILNILKRKLRSLLFSFDKSTQYFSQGGEDAILNGIFKKKMAKGEKGFFIDVGAYHPYKHSNTYYFYLRGWRGINIDASPGSMRLFNKLRPGDINLEVGIGNKKGAYTYYMLGNNSTMNTFSKENLLIHGFKDTKREVQVQMTTLKDIFSRYSQHFSTIDFINIDVEGFDYEVLQSNDWNKFRPHLIVVELDVEEMKDLLNNKSAILLKSLKYKIVAKNVIMKKLASVFFLAEEFDY